MKSITPSEKLDAEYSTYLCGNTGQKIVKGVSEKFESLKKMRVCCFGRVVKNVNPVMYIPNVKKNQINCTFTELKRELF